MICSRTAAVLLGTFALILGIAAPSSAAVLPDGQHCRDDMVTEKFTCAKPVLTRPLTSAQKAELSRIKFAVDNLSSARGGRASGLIPDLPVLPPTYVVPEVAKMRLFKEGEGNHKKSYTCGPSATRNMIAALYKHKKGYYKDFGEAYFERIEGTTRAGTSRKNIADALNAHFSQLGSWTTTRPKDANHYLTYVMVMTSLFKRAVIANLDTKYLLRFNGKQLAHFNLVFGYDKGGIKHVRIGEEWDPIFIYGSSPYGNPYGKFWEPLARAFTAIAHSAIHGIVA